MIDDAEAKRRSVTVGQLLSTLADNAVRAPQPGRRRPVGDVDARIAVLNAEGMSDNRIAKTIGLAQSSVSKRRRDLGLESPTPRAAGSGKKAQA